MIARLTKIVLWINVVLWPIALCCFVALVVDVLRLPKVRPSDSVEAWGTRNFAATNMIGICETNAGAPTAVKRWPMDAYTEAALALGGCSTNVGPRMDPSPMYDSPNVEVTDFVCFGVGRKEVAP